MSSENISEALSPPKHFRRLVQTFLRKSGLFFLMLNNTQGNPGKKNTKNDVHLRCVFKL